MSRRTATPDTLPYVILAFVASVVLVLVCIGAAASVIYPILFTPDLICHDGSQAEIEKNAQFTLPASASDLQAACEKGRYTVWFTMDAAGLDSFLASTRVETPLAAADPKPEFGPTADTDALMAGTWHIEDWRSSATQRIWIDQSDGSRYRVYLEFVARIFAY